MLTILMKTIVNTITNTAVEKYCQYLSQYFCGNIFHCLLRAATLIYLHGHLRLCTKLIEKLLLRYGKITIVYNDVMLMSKHCSSI